MDVINHEPAIAPLGLVTLVQPSHGLCHVLTSLLPSGAQTRGTILG